jgi:hypothetical protein
MARQGDNTVSAFVASSDTNVGELHGCPRVHGWFPLMTVHTNIRNVSSDEVWTIYASVGLSGTRAVKLFAL